MPIRFFCVLPIRGSTVLCLLRNTLDGAKSAVIFTRMLQVSNDNVLDEGPRTSSLEPVDDAESPAMDDSHLSSISGAAHPLGHSNSRFISAPPGSDNEASAGSENSVSNQRLSSLNARNMRQYFQYRHQLFKRLSNEYGCCGDWMGLTVLILTSTSAMLSFYAASSFQTDPSTSDFIELIVGIIALMATFVKSMSSLFKLTPKSEAFKIAALSYSILDTTLHFENQAGIPLTSKLAKKLHQDSELSRCCQIR